MPTFIPLTPDNKTSFFVTEKACNCKLLNLFNTDNFYIIGHNHFNRCCIVTVAKKNKPSLVYGILMSFDMRIVDKFQIEDTDTVKDTVDLVNETMLESRFITLCKSLQDYCEHGLRVN